MKIIFYGLSAAYLLCLVSCERCDYQVSSNYLEGNCSLVNGVRITKLKDVVVIGGIPGEFVEDVDAHFGAFSDKEFSYYLKNPFEKIYFKKKRTGYSWMSYHYGAVYDTLPFSFEKEEWYLIDNLYEGGVASVSLYVYVNKNGTFNTVRRDRPTNF